jgi:hypothetical protein
MTEFWLAASGLLYSSPNLSTFQEYDGKQRDSGSKVTAITVRPFKAIASRFGGFA